MSHCPPFLLQDLENPVNRINVLLSHQLVFVAFLLHSILPRPFRDSPGFLGIAMCYHIFLNPYFLSIAWTHSMLSLFPSPSFFFIRYFSFFLLFFSLTSLLTPHSSSLSSFLPFFFSLLYFDLSQWLPYGLHSLYYLSDLTCDVVSLYWINAET